ncbi:hypothetical protein ACFOSC_27875 [Streptantibioticus rubrisoli]
MSTPRRPLGHGPQAPTGPQHAARHLPTAEDVPLPLYRPGDLEHLAQLRERGVLAPTPPAG